MPNKIGNVLNWASEIDAQTIEQAQKTAGLPFIKGHLALMPDAHIGKGSTVGSVIATKGAIIPSCIGVDIGCGMAAIKLNIKSSNLPDTLEDYLQALEIAVPGGVGKESRWETSVNVKEQIGFSDTVVDKNLQGKAISQMGTLGSGNHFFELCTDESDSVWIVLHSGSRNMGKTLAEIHIDKAKGLMKQYFIELEDPDLAYLVQGTPEFSNYIADMLWAQKYAALNRQTMLDRAYDTFNKMFKWPVAQLEVINCHHNFTQMENHGSENVWITRKGAIKAGVNDLGIIPGSMGTSSFIVQGLGNPASYNSCSHGAGRKMSRAQAKRTFSLEDLETSMEGKIWNHDHAAKLIDEISGSYKDIHQVMEDQKDLVEIKHTLNQILNYKGQ